LKPSVCPKIFALSDKHPHPGIFSDKHYALPAYPACKLPYPNHYDQLEMQVSDLKDKKRLLPTFW
jgi:hypothetical protein